jgi:very-short-patch-repair endonuclease
VFLDRKSLREKRRRARELRQDATPEERTLWHHLRRHQIAGLHFRRQHVLAGFIADFYCHGARLVIELDGNHHIGQMEADTERDSVLRSKGLEILRIPNHIVRENLPATLQIIEETARRRARLPDIRLPRATNDLSSLSP